METGMKKPIVGFIGLGIMGRPMAGHLINAGYSLVILDKNPVPVNELVALGAKSAASPKDVTAQSEVVITMLPDSPDVEAVALEENGIIEGAKAGSVHIDMSSIAPASAIKVAHALGEKGVRCLDAPVSGGQVGAQNAALSIMVGGDADLFAEMLPIFQVLGKTVTHCGAHGAGQIVKACNQVQVALNIAGMCEALVLGAKAGVDPAIIIQVLSGGYAQNRVMDVRGPKVIRGDFQPGFKSRFHFKDLNIILKTGADLDVNLPVTSTVYKLFAELLDAGGGDLDHTGLITVLEKMAKHEARTKPGSQ
jgi:2-hydroxy-3-oxopropionate reductase